ncbi:MAG: hypothetical protein CMJ18_24120 [Phycisphaeraceae bacterium]|nr:hypothetical protein [Phycisphaeraceae bacterium]
MSLCIVDGGRRRQRAMQPVDARQSFETEPNLKVGGVHVDKRTEPAVRRVLLGVLFTPIFE